MCRMSTQQPGALALPPAPNSVPCIVSGTGPTSTAWSRTGSARCTFCIDADTEHTHAHAGAPRGH